MKHLIILAAGLLIASMTASAAQTKSTDSLKNTATAGLSVPGSLQFDDDHIPWPECYPCPENLPPPVPAPPPVPSCWPNCDSCYPNCISLIKEIPSSSANMADSGGIMTTQMTGIGLVVEPFAVSGPDNKQHLQTPGDVHLRE